MWGLPWVVCLLVCNVCCCVVCSFGLRWCLLVVFLVFVTWLLSLFCSLVFMICMSSCIGMLEYMFVMSNQHSFILA
jgi:hypothetical protein